MPSPTAPAPLPSAREILNAAFKDRKLILTTVVATNIVFATLAFHIPPKYTASANLIVLPSPDYEAPTGPGMETSNDAALSREEILPTEAAILGGTSLHEQVVREIGLGNLYPDMVKPPGLLHRLLAWPAGLIHKLRHHATGIAEPSADPVMIAANELGNNLDVTSSQQASIVTVSFNHPDPQMAAQVVNTLVADYLAERQGLYADIRSDTIQQQIAAAQQTLKTQAEKSDDFKQQSAIYDFTTQQTLLLNQIDSLQKDLDEAENAHAQALNRIDTLHAQTRATPVTVMQSTTIDYDSQIASLQTAMNNLLAQEAELLTQFQPDSEPVQTVEQQITMLKATIAQSRAQNMPSTEQVGRNPTFDSVNGNLLQAQVDLSATAAQEATDRRQIRAAIDQLNRLSAGEAVADDLDRQKTLAEQNYQGLVQQYAEVAEAEQLAQRKAENVRLIEPALPPLQPAPLAKLIFEAGIFLSLCLGGLAAVLSDLRRSGFISAAKLRRATGLPLLTSVPENAALAQSVGSFG